MYCVYIHRRIDNNDIVYVGEGRSSRANNFGCVGRNKEYCELIKTTKLYCEVIQGNLTKQEAEALEEDLISKYKLEYTSLTNKAAKSTCALSYKKEDYQDLFVVDPYSPSGLRWLTDRYNLPNGKGYKIITKGDIAGCKNKLTGYWYYMNKSCHRIVYALTYGECPAVLTVDHIDANKDNNSIENLQLMSRGLNSAKSHENRVYNQGEDVHSSKLTKVQVLEIYEMFKSHASNEDVASIYNLHSRYVSLLRHGKRWKELYEEVNHQFNDSFKSISVTADQVKQALDLFLKGLNNKEISEMTGIERSTVSRLRHGKTLKKIVKFVEQSRKEI